MHELAPLIIDLGVMLSLAAFVVLICQRIHQPIVLGYLVAGMIVGPYTPPHQLVNDVANIKILSELGVIFLMFSLGLEFSFHKLTRVGFSAGITGLVEVLFMMVIGFLVGRSLGWTYYDSLFLGGALSISSTTIIVKAIAELKLQTHAFAEIIYGVLVVEDLLAILLLVMLSTVVFTQNILSFDMLLATIKLIMVVGGWFIVGYFLVPTIFRHIIGFVSEETLTVVSVGLCLLLVSIAAKLHYSSALGAFIMGSILAETQAVHRIAKLIEPLRDIFAAVFFIGVGMLIDPKMIWQHWEIVIYLSLTTIFAKVFITTIAALITGQNLATSVRVGFGMGQIGEFSFIIIGLGLSLNVIDQKLYPIIVAVSTVTTFTTPYLIRFSAPFAEQLQKMLPDHILLALNAYSAWMYRTEHSSAGTIFLRSVLIRVFINGIIVALIFSMLHYFVFHLFLLFAENSFLGNFLVLIVSFFCSAPFLWGMLFSYRMTNPDILSQKYKHAVVILAWFLTLCEITLLSLAYFNTVFSVTILMMFIFLSYPFLERSYRWFEHHLLQNIRGK